MRSCGAIPEKHIRAKETKMNERLKEISPICCYLGDKTMEVLLEQAKR